MTIEHSKEKYETRIAELEAFVRMISNSCCSDEYSKQALALLRSDVCDECGLSRDQHGNPGSFIPKNIS
jgi:hypothetical protein